MDIRKYVGYISAEENQLGNCLIIDKNKAVTASHVLEYVEGSFLLYCNGFSFLFDKTALRQKKSVTVIEFEEDIFEWFDSNGLKINADFDATALAQEWKSFGYLPCRDKTDFTRIGGRGFNKWSDRYPFVLHNLYIQNGSCSGMSGSPVVVSEMVVGILQAEDINNDGIVENLYFSPVTDFIDDIQIDCIQGNVFQNTLFPKTNYYDKFDLDGYIPRKVVVSEQENNPPVSLVKIINEKTKRNIFVLVGEAGLGKTYELQRLAIELYDSYYYPIYFTLKEFNPLENPADQIPCLAEYIFSKVPFCLILDGYDEIKNTNYRDVDFPNVISRFADMVNQQYHGKQLFAIVISSRKNYYYSGKITGAENVVLCDLSENDINMELEKHNILPTAFYDEIRAKRLNTFISNPFYLKHIIKLFKADEGVLPAASSLMDSIIVHLFKDKNYEKYRGQSFRLTEENTKGRKLLQKISACFIIQGKMSLSQDEIIQITDGYMGDNDLSLVESTNIFEKRDDDAWEFTHNNFCEYLAAEFFNEKYKDDLTGLLDIIAYENKKGIYNNYINSIAFLLQIRNQPDLHDWLVTHCPNTYYNIEQHQISEGSALTILESVNRIANEKKYYILHDFDMPIEKIINNQSCIIYLTKILEDSTDEREILNAVRLIRELNDLCGCETLVKNALILLLSSGKCNHHHIRDTIMALVDLNLCDDEVTEFLYHHYSTSHDKEILRGINQYILKFDKADLFIDALVFQLKNVDRFEYIGSYHYVCLKNLKEENSFIKLFTELMSMDDTEQNCFRSSSFKDILLLYNNNLIKLWNSNNNDALFDAVLRFTVYLVSNYIVDNNVFAEFLNITKKDEEAINYYYDTLKEQTQLFFQLSNKLNCYLSFLCRGYSDGKYREDNNHIFDYCAKVFNADSDERKQCISLICEKGYDDAADSIRYITANDDYEENQKLKKRQRAKYIFDFSKLVADLRSVVKESGLENPTCRALFDYVYKHFSYNSFERVVFGFAWYVFYSDDTIEKNIDYFNRNQFEWLIRSFKKYCSNHTDYADFISKDEIDCVLKQTEQNLVEKDFSQCNPYLLKDEISLIEKFNYDLPEWLLLAFMKIHTGFFGYQCSKGFPDYLTERLSHEKIIKQIESFIENDEWNSNLCDACILYCYSTSFVSEKMIDLAVRVLCNEFSNDNHYYAWNYLKKSQKIDLLVSMILSGKIDKGFSSFQMSSLNDYYDADLACYVSDLFDELNAVYQSEINEDNIAELSEKYQFVIRSDYITDAVDKLKKNLLECLKCLFSYLVNNNIGHYIDFYLDYMLENKTYSYLEYDIHDTLFTKIKSKDYLEKSLKVLELFFTDEFRKGDSYPTLYTDIRTAILNIGQKYPDETLAKLASYPARDNADLCRAVSLLYDDLFKAKYEKAIKPYSFEETTAIVFG